jgi:selenocysteine-specific elongation factor
MIVGTAGHIDHGKTSLVRALTGVDTDRLPEEKARGITLDLGFAYVPLQDGGVLGFVDVPGHERLVHTMIAGATSIGMALLVVAADDGVMPQTREHLQILSLLGVTRGVVALTKTDLVDPDRATEVELDIVTLLDETPLAGAPVFPVSTVTGEGIAALRAFLLHQAANDPAATDGGGRAFRLAIDRVFSLSGTGTVVTGSVVSGDVGVGDSVLIPGLGSLARVRGIHAANQPVQRAWAGQRCALNLAGPGIRKDAVGRGDWAVDPTRAATSRRWDVTIRLLDTEAAALKHWTPVLLHHGAGQITARVVLLDPPVLRPGEQGLAQLVTHTPAPARRGDRVVLRDIAASRTLAGGIVLDPDGPERHRRRPERLDVLRALNVANDTDALRGWLLCSPFLIRHDALLANWGLRDGALDGLAPDAVRVGPFIAAADPLARLTRTVIDTLASSHARQPAARGMTAEAVRLAQAVRTPRDAFAALITHLIAAGAIETEAHLLCLPGHTGGLAGEEARLWNAVRPLLTEAPFRPPLVREAAAIIGVSDIVLRRACKSFARMGLIMELAPDRFFSRDAAVAMAETAHGLSAGKPDGFFTAAEFRDRLGNGRQLAIQILDYFDRRGITVRRGDLRVAGKSVAQVFGGGTAGG